MFLPQHQSQLGVVSAAGYAKDAYAEQLTQFAPSVTTDPTVHEHPHP